MDKKKLESLREQYPQGSRIKLNQTMNDPFHPVPQGMMGTVEHIDDMGTIHMAWDNGQGLGLIIGEDDFSLIENVENVEKVEKARELRVVIVEPDQEPRVETIYDTLYHMQKIVGGNIETVSLDDDSVLVCNEAGKILHLKPNRSVNDDIIVGTFFIVRTDGSEEFQSLTEEQINKYMTRFYEIEYFNNIENTEIKMGGL